MDGQRKVVGLVVLMLVADSHGVQDHVVVRVSERDVERNSAKGLRSLLDIVARRKFLRSTGGHPCSKVSIKPVEHRWVEFTLDQFGHIEAEGPALARKGPEWLDEAEA